MEYKDRQTNVNYEECLDYVRRSSNPSKLRITDVKFTKVDLPPWGCYRCGLIRTRESADTGKCGMVPAPPT